jgi:hypothetical protein
LAEGGALVIWSRLITSKVIEDSPWVRMSCTKRDRGYPQIKVSLSRAVVEWLGVEEGQMLDVLRGYDDHAGWIRLTPGADGYVLTSYNQSCGALAVKFSGRHLGIRDSHRQTHVSGDSVVLGRDGIVPVVSVELPEWAYQPISEDEEMAP